MFQLFDLRKILNTFMNIILSINTSLVLLPPFYEFPGSQQKRTHNLEELISFIFDFQDKICTIFEQILCMIQETTLGRIWNSPSTFLLVNWLHSVHHAIGDGRRDGNFARPQSRLSWTSTQTDKQACLTQYFTSRLGNYDKIFRL